MDLRDTLGTFVLTVLALVAADARAQTSPVTETGEAPAVVAVDSTGEGPVPAPVSTTLPGKRRIGDRDLAYKTEGSYFTGLPLLDSDPDTGFGFGGRVYHYWNGSRTDPLFAYAPYEHRVSALVFFTTNGYQAHEISWDAPNIGGSAFRVRASALYERNKAANYFGVGAATLHDLSFSQVPGGFTKFNDYTAALRQIRPNGLAYSLYDKYDRQTPSLQATIDRDLFGGLVRLQGGFFASYERIRDYSGAETTGDDLVNGLERAKATMGATRLREDCAANRIIGCAGGVHNVLKIGIAFDTRDYEPDPNSGVFIDLTGEVSDKHLLSDFEYLRGTFAARGFVSPFPELTDLVLAGRVAYSVQSSGTPFFAMSTLAFTDGDRQGLGGVRTLRGYKQNRFVGPISALANVELRWTFVKFAAWQQSFGLSIAPFLDVGRVFDRVAEFTFKDWKQGEGAGLRIAWNQATIIVFDVGLSREDRALYIDFGHQF